MAELLKTQSKVKYLHQGEWLNGIVHGVKTHEEPDGQVTRLAYLIDTGKDDVRHESIDIKGKKEVFRQPELIEVEAHQVKLA